MTTAWMDQGLLKRREALLLAHHWTKMGHSIRLEHTGRRKLFHVYLRVRRDNASRSNGD